MKRNINLLPPDDQKLLIFEGHNRRIMQFGAWLILSLVLTAATALGAKFFLSATVRATSEQVQAKQAELVQIEESSVQTQVQVLDSNLQNFQNLDRQRMIWSGYLTELAKLLPHDIAVTSLTISRTTGKVEIAGTAATRESVLQLRENILASSYFEKINFPLFNLQQATNVNWKYQFFLKALPVQSHG